MNAKNYKKEQRLNNREELLASYSNKEINNMIAHGNRLNKKLKLELNRRVSKNIRRIKNKSNLITITSLIIYTFYSILLCEDLDDFANLLVGVAIGMFLSLGIILRIKAEDI